MYIESIPIYGQLGRKQEALKIWRKLLEEKPSASAESFEHWFHLWNMRDEDIAKLMDGVYKSGVLGGGGEHRPVTRSRVEKRRAIRVRKGSLCVSGVKHNRGFYSWRMKDDVR